MFPIPPTIAEAILDLKGFQTLYSVLVSLALSCYIQIQLLIINFCFFVLEKYLETEIEIYPDNIKIHGTELIYMLEKLNIPLNLSLA